MSVRTTNAEDLPELGSRQAAVQSCVSLIAGMSSQPEIVMAYWLDLYYQVRRAFERETEPQAQPQFIRPEDLIASLHSLWQDMMSENAVMAPPATPEAEKPEEAQPENAQPEADQAKTNRPYLVGNTISADSSKFKRETRERLERLRAKGVTAAMILEVADGAVNHDQIMNILECQKVPVSAYRSLAGVLDKIEN